MKAQVRSIQIRPIAEDDFDGFRECLDAVARERKFLGLLQAPPIEDTRRWLLKAMRQNDIRLVAVDRGRIVGWCDIEPYAREGFGHAGKLGMGLLQAYRSRGIGRALLTQALRAARERNLERVELDVYASNRVALRLYEKFGFQIEGRKQKARKIDGQYDDVILMALLLDAHAAV